MTEQEIKEIVEEIVRLKDLASRSFSTTNGLKYSREARDLELSLRKQGIFIAKQDGLLSLVRCNSMPKWVVGEQHDR